MGRSVLKAKIEKDHSDKKDEKLIACPEPVFCGWAVKRRMPED